MPVATPIIPESEKIEILIGDAVAGASLALIEGARIYAANGGQISPATKVKTNAGGKFIAMLVELQKATHEEIDFEAVARDWGAKALRKRVNGHGYHPAVTGDEIINDVLAIVRDVSHLVAVMAEVDKTPLLS